MKTKTVSIGVALWRLVRRVTWRFRQNYNDGAPAPLAYQPQHAWSDGDFDGWINLGRPTISKRKVRSMLCAYIACHPNSTARVLEIKSRSRIVAISDFLPNTTVSQCPAPDDKAGLT